MSTTYFKPGTSRYKLSTNYEFFAVNQEGKRIKIGGCQSLNDSQTKNVTRTHELNMEEPICVELTQGLITDISVTVSRIELNVSNLLEEFTGIQGIESLYNQSLYFDIEAAVYIPRQNSDGTFDPKKENATRIIQKTYKDCVITNYSHNCDITGNIQITENATIQVRYIQSGSKSEN